jgi:hypothetical protein
VELVIHPTSRAEAKNVWSFFFTSLIHLRGIVGRQEKRHEKQMIMIMIMIMIMRMK